MIKYLDRPIDGQWKQKLLSTFSLQSYYFNGAFSVIHYNPSILLPSSSPQNIPCQVRSNDWLAPINCNIIIDKMSSFKWISSEWIIHPVQFTEYNTENASSTTSGGEYVLLQPAICQPKITPTKMNRYQTTSCRYLLPESTQSAQFNVNLSCKSTVSRN